jgi:hypothetical protein
MFIFDDDDRRLRVVAFAVEPEINTDVDIDAFESGTVMISTFQFWYRCSNSCTHLCASGTRRRLTRLHEHAGASVQQVPVTLSNG